MWALLNFLLPDVFSSSQDFDDWFQMQGSDPDQVVQQLQKVLQPFLLRRIKAEVEKSLLPKKRINLYVDMADMQRKWYQKLLEKDIEAVNGALKGKEGKTRLLNIVMQLRKCCNHPYLFDGAEPGPPFTTEYHLVENSGKMMILDKLLARLKESGSRVLLFSQMSRMLNILEDYCFWRGFDYCRIDGQTAHEDRVESIDEFNKPNSKKFIFLLTTRAGGLGINLATADIVVMFDNDWNPQVDLQAEDRAHRIGQKKQVVVFRFMTENTVEEKIIDKATQKLRLDQLVIQQGRSTQSKAASKDDLLSMIQFGANEIFNSASKSSSQKEIDIEEILKRSEEKTKELNKKYNQMGFDELQKFTVGGEGSSVYQWEGEDFSNKRKSESIGLTWIQPTKRERKVNYAVDQYYRDALRTGGRSAGVSKQPSAPRPPKLESIYDFQFYPGRLSELLDKEILAYRRSVGWTVPANRQLESGETEEDVEKQRIQEQALIDNAEPLTEQEIEEKEALLKQGFGTWTKKDFNAFVKASEKYGREDLANISTEIDGKTAEEVEAFAKTFWERYEELAGILLVLLAVLIILDWEKLIQNIERGESKIRKQGEIQEMINTKVSKSKHPLQQLRLNYGGSKGKNFTEEEDRFLLVMLAKFGFSTDDVYDKIRQEIKRSSMFRFDWFFKSRTSTVTLVFLAEYLGIGKEVWDIGDFDSKRVCRFY